MTTGGTVAGCAQRAGAGRMDTDRMGVGDLPEAGFPSAGSVAFLLLLLACGCILLPAQSLDMGC